MWTQGARRCHPIAGLLALAVAGLLACGGGGGGGGDTSTSPSSQAPAITSPAQATFTEGAAGRFTFTAAGRPVPALTVAGQLPAGVGYNSATGVLAGTPAAGSHGSYPLAVAAGNGVAPDAAQDFTLTVAQVPVAPDITSADHASFTAGSAGSFTVAATGTPAPALAVAGTLPAGVAFNAATGLLAGTPAAGSQGLYPLTFTAGNGVPPDAVQAFSLLVAMATGAPAITSADHATFTAGAAGSFTVTATGIPAPSLAVAGTLPAGVTFTPVTGLLAGTPAAGSQGAYALTFTAANGVAPDAAQGFTLQVAVAPRAPAITSADHAAFTTGAAGSFTVTATGNPAPVLALTGTLPAGVAFTPATGLLAGTPAAGSQGTYPLTLTAANGVAPDATQAFTLQVALAPPRPGHHQRRPRRLHRRCRPAASPSPPPATRRRSWPWPGPCRPA